MTAREELRVWTEAVAAVLAHDIETGKATANPDVPELETPLLAACLDVRETLERIVRRGGRWRGEWVEPDRYVRRRAG